jgi:hypothetical protein
MSAFQQEATCELYFILSPATKDRKDRGVDAFPMAAAIIGGTEEVWYHSDPFPYVPNQQIQKHNTAFRLPRFGQALAVARTPRGAVASR